MNKTPLFNQIEDIIEEGVNPALAAHNGFVILAGVEEVETIKVILEFHGGCAGCPASFTFTLKTIENYLREELGTDDLVVINSEMT